ncbi:MAG TPA: ABC transporter substrate-binding protein [Pelobium sp.]
MILKPAIYSFLITVFCFIVACSPKTAPVTKVPSSQKVDEKLPEKEVISATQQPVQKKVLKPEMIISMILPFELKTIDYKSAGLADLKKAEIAIDLYQGFKMALDSVAKQSGNVDFKLQIFDSNDNPTALAALAIKPAIINSDLIIGPVFPNGIKTFSIYSKRMQKPMVSPLAASDPVLFSNPYLITVNNSLDQHAYKAVKFIKNNLKPKKVLLIRSGDADEYKYAVPFKKGMDSLAKGYRVSEIGIKAIGYENVYKYFDPTGLNVIVLPTTDRIFLLTLFKELEKASRNFQIAVIGHPNWEKATFLDYQLMEAINAYTTSSYQVNYQSNRITDFTSAYRSKFLVEPSEYAIKGFDIAYYFASLMDKNGHEFMDNLLREKFDGIHNDFIFKKDDQTGYFNSSLMILRFEDSKLVKVD